MPSVQVKEFPQDLYDQLKAYSDANHRSMAQQLVVAAEQMLASQRPIPITPDFASTGVSYGVVKRTFNEAERAARTARRRNALAAMEHIRNKLREEGSPFLAPEANSSVNTLREDREKASRHTGGPQYFAQLEEDGR